MDGLMDGWMNGWMNARINSNRQTGRQTDGRTDRRTDGRYTHIHIPRIQMYICACIPRPEVDNQYHVHTHKMEQPAVWV